MMEPLVSVILPVYNAQDYIKESINSILSQRYQNIELIVIDDGSTDNSFAIVKDICENDSRISLYSQPNQGLIYTLNKMIKLCRGEYIARMDADDLALPNRIEQQVAFLMANPDIALVGSSYYSIDKLGKFIGTKRNVFSHPAMVKASIAFGCPIAHPTVMFNRDKCGSALYYSSEYAHAEDIELWSRLVFEHNLCIANIKEPLLLYRIHNESISHVYSNLQQEAAYKCLLRYDSFSFFNNDIDKVKFLYNAKSDLSLLLVLKLNFFNLKLNAFPKSALLCRSLIALAKRFK